MARTSCENKIQVTVNIAARVETAISAEAKRLGISFSDMVRRVTDDWMDRREHQTGAPREVLVLDRESNQVRRAR